MSEDKKGSTTSGAEAPFPPSWPPAAGKRPQSGIQAGPGTPSGGSNPDFFAGQELCGYTIKRKLAEGRTGVLYEGEHTELGRRGAIKVLKVELCRSEDSIERFYQQARAVNSIRHENIVEIYDFDRDPYGRVAFVMEYLEGEPLSARIRRSALPWSEAFPILEQALRGLQAAHDKGIAHAVLKPDRIWLKSVEGRVQVKLLDFGISNLIGAEANDHHTDIHAMGAIACEMFAGASAFGDIPESLGVPAAVNDIVDRMITKDAAGRYESVADVLADLHDVNRNERPADAETLELEPPTLSPQSSLPESAPAPAPVPPPPPPASVSAPAPVPTPAAPPPPPPAPAPPPPPAPALVSAPPPPPPPPSPSPARASALAPQAPALAPPAPAPPAPAPPAPALRPAEPRASRSRAMAFAAAAVAVVAIAIVAIVLLKSQKAPESPVVSPPPPPPPVAEKPPDPDAIRQEALATLRASLKESEPAVRAQGADALGQLGDQPSVPVLTELTEKDPDPEVRGHAAVALSMIGAPSVMQLLVKLEAAASPPLKVWYAAAIARLGDQDAREHLLTYAHDKDLAVSFKAVITYAEISPSGDLNAIAALKALALHEAELDALAPTAGEQLLTKMAARHDASARKRLLALLDDKDEGTRLAAAEGLAKLGDDAGKKTLEELLANKASPNQLAAAVALIPLGEYGGVDLITAKLGDKAPETRRLAASALGEIGDRKSIPALLALAKGKDWTLRIPAAAALVAILGLDPKVLAQASVDWVKRTLDSQDGAMREAAAGVLADLPLKEAIPLLARAVADPDPKVRLAAARSAGRMKSPEAAAKVTARVKAETDPAVKEQQIKALGEIGSPAARDTLAQISEEPGRIGVFAAGSLMAVGDASGKAKLETAAAAPQPELRLAAMQAASFTKNPIVVPMLKTGVADAVLDVRFAAAEGLAAFNAEKAAALPVLTAALESKDTVVLGRAMAALVKLGEPLAGKARTPAELLDSADPKLRLAVVPIVRALPVNDGVPLLRRLVADLAHDVRRAAVDAIEGVVPKAKDQAITLYKPLVGAADPVLRSKASGQLARLLPPSP